MVKQKLYKREMYLKKIRGFYDETEIIKVLIGVRRCGKSSIMRMIADELIERGVDRKNIIFISLDLRPHKKIRTTDALENVIDLKSEQCDRDSIKYLFIDEIQNVVGFEETINALREEGFSIFITGSNGYLLSGELATKLTGRYIEFEISTLSFSEYLGMKAFLGKEISVHLENEFVSYIREGGFPYAVRFDSYEDKHSYTESVIDEIYEKDIRRNKKIRHKQLFNKLMIYIINNFGATTSISRLCRALSDISDGPVRKETLYNYLSILENARIISRCNRFDMKSRKSLNGEEKYYLTDLAFYYSKNTDNNINYGPALENIVYNYARSLGYSVSIGRIGKLEVDFILRDANRNYCYVQVAKTIYNERFNADGNNITENREYASLESIRDGYPKYLLTMDLLLQERSGVKHLNIIQMMKDEVRF